MSFSYLAFISFCSILGRLNSASTITFFISGTYRISKSKSRIHVNHCVISALDRSIIVRFSYAASIIALVSAMNETLYNQCLNFLRVFRRARHSLFPALYRDSVANYRSLLYLVGCLLLSPLFTYIRTALYSLLLALKINIISSVFFM